VQMRQQERMLLIECGETDLRTSLRWHLHGARSGSG
jgi:hypothetical protein